jgi:hypothetical protein
MIAILIYRTGLKMACSSKKELKAGNAINLIFFLGQTHEACHVAVTSAYYAEENGRGIEQTKRWRFSSQPRNLL